jgi:anthranilate synthase/aminodeoxychorismate synthase-like glutamine amidotransferase
MILVVDNYDSFTYNLVQYLGELGEELSVHRNDRITLDEIAAMSPERIVLSPGPCTPNEAGICVPLIQRFGASIPILGVCLGHQSIGAAYGGDIVRNHTVMHGKVSSIHHDGAGLFHGLPNPMVVTRYHSLVIRPETMPPCLEVCASTDLGEVMAVRHRQHPVHGVQFHPESVMTPEGKALLKNFLQLPH